MPLTARRQPARGPSSWLSTTRTYGTSLSSHHAIAAWAANVLQPETTTTCGRASVSAPTTPGRDRVVVPDDVLGAGHAEAAEVDGAVRRVDPPGPPGDGAGGVEDREVDLGERRDPVEERRPVRRRLREDRGDADRRGALAVPRVASASPRPRGVPSPSRRRSRLRATTLAGQPGIEPKRLARDARAVGSPSPGAATRARSRAARARAPRPKRSSNASSSASMRPRPRRPGSETGSAAPTRQASSTSSADSPGAILAIAARATRS